MGGLVVPDGIGGGASGGKAFADPVAGALTDRLTFGDGGEETSHSLTTSGTSATATIASDIGDVSGSYATRYMEGAGSEVSFELAIDGDEPLTLEFQEIHDRREDAFGYRIFVDGTAVYFRSYEAYGSGPNHFFVHVPETITSSKSSVTVTLTNVGESRVSLGQVWAYSQFEDLIDQENAVDPMGIVLMNPLYDPKYGDFTTSDYSSDLDKVTDLKETYAGDYRLYGSEIGLAFDIRYMKFSEEELRSRIDYVLQLSRDSDMPLYLDFNSWWSGTPSGPDGLGGYWGDIRYQQIVYDPLTETYRPSIPNIWGNTPWMTMNDDHYNEVRNQKIEWLSRYVSYRLAMMRLEDGDLPQVSLFLENEPIYWPEYSFKASPQAAGDYNSAVTGDASADSVALDPADGLSQEEREWLFGNLTAYIKGEAGAMAEGEGKNAVLVDNGSLTLPDDQLSENSYTHSFIDSGFPILDKRKGKWESHRLDEIRFGGEFIGIEDPRYFDYIAAAGKFSDINFERSSASDLDDLSKIYGYGTKDVVLFNRQAGDEELLERSDMAPSTEVTPDSYERAIYSLDFNDSDSLDAAGPLTGVANLSRDPLGDRYTVSPDDSSEYGSLKYHFTHGGLPFDQGLLLNLEGRILSALDAGCKIEVWAGTDPDALQLERTLGTLPAKVDLSGIAADEDDVYVELRLYTNRDNSNWTTLSALQAGIPWEYATGHSDGFRYSLEETRAQRQWIGYRADAERLLAEYLERGTEDVTYTHAKELFDDGLYASAYRLLTGQLSQQLPAKYAVKGHGALGKYPISLQLSSSNDRVLATLTAYDDEELELTLATDGDQSMLLSWQDRTDGDYYKLESLGDNRFRVSESTSADPEAAEAADGEVAFALSAEAEHFELPEQFTGVYRGYDQATRSIEAAVPDPEVGEYIDKIAIPLADNVSIKRGEIGSLENEMMEIPAQAIVYGDRVDFSMDEAGKADTVRAYYGQETGELDEMNQVSVVGTMSNGGIALLGGNDYVFRGYTRLNLPLKADATPFLTPPGQIDLEPGEEVGVYYTPYLVSGTAYDALTVFQPFDSVVNEDYQSDDADAWKATAEDYGNLQAELMDLNGQDKVLTTVNHAAPGYVTYRVESPDEINKLIVEYSARAIIDEDNGVEVYTSDDGTDWTLAGSMDTDTPVSPTGTYTLDLSDAAAGQSELYIKFRIFSSNFTWGALSSLKILNGTSFKTLESADLTADSYALYGTDTTALHVDADYDDASPVYKGDANMVYVSDDETVATIDKNGVVTPGAVGTAHLTAYVTKGAEMVKSNTIAIQVRRAEPTVILEDDYEADDDAEWQAQAFNYTNVTAAALDGNEEAKGLVGQDQSHVGSVTYKATSAAAGGFMKLALDYRARGILGAYVKVYAGDSPGSLSLLATVEDDGDWDKTRSLDLTSLARRKDELYIKFEIYSNLYNWGYLGDIKLTQTDFPDDYVVYEPIDEDFEASGDSEWQAAAAGYANLTSTALDTNVSDRGLVGQDQSQVGSVTYKITSAAASGFMKLALDYRARGILGAYVKVYAGDSPGSLSLAATVEDDGDWDKARRLDLTSLAQRKDEIYVKFEVYSALYNWGYLGDVKFTEVNFPLDYDVVPLLNQDYEVSSDTAWEGLSYSYDNLTSTALDDNYSDKGLVGQAQSQAGSVVYEVSSGAENGFDKLVVDYGARGILGAYVKVYAGTSPSSLGLVATVENDGDWQATRKIDLTSLALHENTVYVKFEVYSLQFNWGYLGNADFYEVAYHKEI
ncbi:Ig domain-containing protein [Cohnella sp. GCM10020058]|uniref:Ig-like domain-containing protein n=1 Tax=Cohnella sp. GCM10020058 TaxID=3317330 RepID=UPI0036385A49